jgi:hypothetical protein
LAHDVFISYSHSDKTVADAACAKLEAAGIRCWIASRDIAPGAEWGESIVDAIDHSRVMVLIFSSNANESRQVRREVERAVSKSVTIVPVRIEDVEPTRSLAYFMAGVHWLDALTPPLERHLERLASSIKAFLATAPSNPKPQEESRPNAAEPPLTRVSTLDDPMQDASRTVLREEEIPRGQTQQRPTTEPPGDVVKHAPLPAQDSAASATQAAATSRPQVKDNFFTDLFAVDKKKFNLSSSLFIFFLGAGLALLTGVILPVGLHDPANSTPANMVIGLACGIGMALTAVWFMIAGGRNAWAHLKDRWNKTSK